MSLLGSASFVVTHLPVDEEHGEVNWVEIGDRGIETSSKAPRKGHEEVTADESLVSGIDTLTRTRDVQVVRMLAQTPPSGDQELGATFGIHGL